LMNSYYYLETVQSLPNARKCPRYHVTIKKPSRRGDNPSSFK